MTSKLKICASFAWKPNFITSLSIRKDAGVIAHEGIVQQALSKALEHHVLTWTNAQINISIRTFWTLINEKVTGRLPYFLLQTFKIEFNTSVNVKVALMQLKRLSLFVRAIKSSAYQEDNKAERSTEPQAVHKYWPANLSFCDSSMDQKQWSNAKT